ncbi:DUF4056 domain-containing protein [Vibrio algicola]|uniref:DUF4056 domain-containing protein n=1 Tax=Vibrio algicola TaxID=2662262 RepID=A0A5Q0TEX4_9VIBR|nr:DUF4056 domain-containing protein [Vibrio algicola]
MKNTPWIFACLLFGVTGCSSNSWQETTQPQASDVAQILASAKPIRQDTISSATSFELPTEVRPCCAFGNRQRVEVGKIKVPFFQLPNTADIDALGLHIYGSSQFSMRKSDDSNVVEGEHNGILYTVKGGFIDLAHVRDTADNTVGLFYKIYPKLGQEFSIELEPELGARSIHFKAFPTEHLTEQQKRTLSIELAAYYAFKMAQGHEISQWHGFKSFPLFPELVSAYSLEDLYSNMLGAKLASKLVIDNLALSLNSYNRNMTVWIQQALEYLQPLNKELSSAAFNAVDGIWWDSHVPIPQKYMILKRNYQLTMQQTPALLTRSIINQGDNTDLDPVIPDDIKPLTLSLTDRDFNIVFDDISSMSMKIENRYLDSFSDHIPANLYPDNTLDSKVYPQIGLYDQQFDKKEYQAIMDKREQKLQ